MFYRKNMGSKESGARGIGGALIVACSLTQIGPTQAEYFAQVPKDELRIDLVRALESLPDMSREVILLRDMEQLTIGEVADRLHITREACKSPIHRVRALLREYLQGDELRGGKK